MSRRYASSSKIKIQERERELPYEQKRCEFQGNKNSNREERI